MSEELPHSIINAGTAPGAQPVFDLAKFWQEQLSLADNFDSDFKNHPLPLARIKKVMKTDQDVKVHYEPYLSDMVDLIQSTGNWITRVSTMFDAL